MLASSPRERSHKLDLVHPRSTFNTKIGIAMKIALGALLLSWLSVFCIGEGDDDCTHGKLFISDRNSSVIRVYNLDGSLRGLLAESNVTVPGGFGQVLQGSHSGINVVSTYTGTSSMFLADGRVNFIFAGVTNDEHGDHFHLETVPPTVYSNAFYDCGPVYHASSRDHKIALFCDGSFTSSPQRNTTIAVFDETLFGTSGNARLSNLTLQGSHHGAAITVDDNHVLHSLPTQNRIDRIPGASSSPETFQVVDYLGNVLHSIGNLSDVNQHCKGFHGSAAVDGTFLLGCGSYGLLSVQYNESTETYTSRAIKYPTLHAAVGYRTGGFHYHEKSDYIVGNLNSPNATLDFYLIAVHETDTAVLESSMLNLGTTYVNGCPRGFELADGKIFVMVMPNGNVRVYTLDGFWNLRAEMPVIPGVTSCSGIVMVPGYHQAFVLHQAAQKMYSLNLEGAMKGNVTMETSDLGFYPASATVSGVPPGTECTPKVTTPPPRCIAQAKVCVLGAANTTTPCCGVNRCVRPTVGTGPRTCRPCKKVAVRCVENRDCCSRKCVLRPGTQRKFCRK